MPFDEMHPPADRPPENGPRVRRWSCCVGAAEAKWRDAPADTHCWVHVCLYGDAQPALGAWCALVSLTGRFDEMSTPEQTSFACENFDSGPAWFATLLAVVGEWGDHRWRRQDGRHEPVPAALLEPLRRLVEGECDARQFHDALFGQG